MTNNMDVNNAHFAKNVYLAKSYMIARSKAISMGDKPFLYIPNRDAIKGYLGPFRTGKENDLTVFLNDTIPMFDVVLYGWAK